LPTVEEKAEQLLADAIDNAWNSLAHGKFSLFGYWAAKVVQFRELLGKSREPGPFHDLVQTAIKVRTMTEKP
jgi:hypothetical protein